jgi:hypothetical protein
MISYEQCTVCGWCQPFCNEFGDTKKTTPGTENCIKIFYVHLPFQSITSLILMISKSCLFTISLLICRNHWRFPLHHRSPQIRATHEARAKRRSATLSFCVLSGGSEAAWAEYPRNGEYELERINRDQ